MSDTFWTVFFTALPPTLMALASLIASLRNSRKMDSVQRDTNGRLDQLVASTGEMNLEKGTREGRAAVLAEQDAAAIEKLKPKK